MEVGVVHSEYNRAITWLRTAYYVLRPWMVECGFGPTPISMGSPAWKSVILPPRWVVMCPLIGAALRG